MNIHVTYQLEDERCAFLFEQQLGVSFGSFTDPDVSNLSVPFSLAFIVGQRM